MKWFEKKEGQERPRNHDNTFFFRLLAAGYVLYMAWKTLELYLAGGEDAPELWLLCLSMVVLGGGGIWLAISSFKTWRKAKAQEKEAEQENE